MVASEGQRDAKEIRHRAADSAGPQTDKQQQEVSSKVQESSTGPQRSEKQSTITTFTS